MRRAQLGAEPSTLTTDSRALATTCEPASAGSGAADLAGAGGREAAEDVGEAVGVDRVAQRSRTAPAPGRGSTLSTPSSSALLRTAPASHGSDDEPSGTATSQATISTAKRETNAPPTSSSRRPVRLVIACRRWVPSQPARAWPSTASPKIAIERDDDPDGAVGEPLGEQRTELQADQRAAEEADERKGADDEALPVAADREHDHQQHEDHVDDGHPFRVRAAHRPSGAAARATRPPRRCRPMARARR